MSEDAAAVAAIDALFAAWIDAVASRDVETVLSLVADDCEFWTHGAPPVTDKATMRAVLEAFYQRFTHRQRFERQEILVRDDVAFVRGMEHNELRPLDGGDVVEVRQRAFMLLRREGDGRWRFARGMTNLPPAAPAPAPR